MPCVTYDPEYERKKYADNEKNKAEQKFADLKKHSDKVTRLLCFVMTAVEQLNDASVHENDKESINASIYSNRELQQWWRKHLEEDAKAAAAKEAKEARKALEKAVAEEEKAIKAAAIAKLTPKEKKLLGL